MVTVALDGEAAGAAHYNKIDPVAVGVKLGLNGETLFNDAVIHPLFEQAVKRGHQLIVGHWQRLGLTGGPAVDYAIAIIEQLMAQIFGIGHISKRDRVEYPQ